MAKIIPITETLVLDHCWVCENSVNDFEEFEQHHILPKHLGGADGPTVTLCNGCHKKVHDSAEALYKGKQKLPFKEQGARERCLYLATIICRGRIAVESQGGFNKRFVYTSILSYEEHELLVSLAKYYGKSQKELIRFALNFLANKTF